MELIRLNPVSGDHLTPRQIVAELDKYIVRQVEAKRSHVGRALPADSQKYWWATFFDLTY